MIAPDDARKPLHVPPRRFPRNPLAFTTRHRRAAVQAGRQLQSNKWPAARDPGHKSFIEPQSRLASSGRCGPRFPPHCKLSIPVPATFGLRILHCDDDDRHTCGNQCLGAGRRPSVMRARFERDVGRASPRLCTCRFKRIDFRVRLAGSAMPAFADNLAVLNQDTADPRIGMSRIQATSCQAQGLRHHSEICRSESGHGYFFLPRSSGSNDICSRAALASEISCNRLISS